MTSAAFAPTYRNNDKCRATSLILNSLKVGHYHVNKTRTIHHGCSFLGNIYTRNVINSLLGSNILFTGYNKNIFLHEVKLMCVMMLPLILKNLGFLWTIIQDINAIAIYLVRFELMLVKIQFNRSWNVESLVPAYS